MGHLLLRGKVQTQLDGRDWDRVGINVVCCEKWSNGIFKISPWNQREKQ